MAFVLKLDGSYSWPVNLELPTDGGRFERQSFEAEFRRLPQDRVTEILVNAQRIKIAVETNQDLEGLLKDVEVADEILIGWKGILDENGKEVPYSEGLKEQLIQIPSVASSICEAWVQSVQKARKGN